MEIYLNPSKEIHVTHEEFNRFTYYDVAAFFINYKACISLNDDNSYRIWTRSYELTDSCRKNHRFRDIDWYEQEMVELYYCDVNDNYLKTLLKNKFNHLFLK